MRHPPTGRTRTLVTSSLLLLPLAACAGGASDPQAPGNLQYSSNPAVYPIDSAIAVNTPTSTGEAVQEYVVAPALPAGLSLDASTGVISGTPTTITAAAAYTVTASNEFGSSSRDVLITITDRPPAIGYASSTLAFVGGAAITPLVPSNSGGAVVTFSVDPALPAGLSLDTSTGVVSGTPSVVAATISYRVTATNGGGSSSVDLSITVSAPPLTVTLQPQAQFVTAGSAPTFSVTASGTGALSYQWTREGSDVGGATGTSHTTPTTTAGDDGAIYQVRVTDTFGTTTTSDAVQLGVVAGSVSNGTALPMARGKHSAVALPDGDVLLVGGQNDEMPTSYTSALRYDPVSDSYAATTGTATQTRVHNVAVRLADGRVLVTGNRDQTGPTAAELFDPVAGTFASTGALNGGRNDHTATLLPDGRVLICGGDNSGALATCELYDPAAGTFSTTGSMASARSGHTATLLLDGTVLVCGGGATALATCELYDPSAGTFSAADTMSTARRRHAAVRLGDGRVLVVGGDNGSSFEVTAELYDPALGSFYVTGSLATARADATAVLLANGRVLVVGGEDASNNPIASLEVYDPNTGQFATPASLANARATAPAAVLPDGDVLVPGGDDLSFTMMTSAELFDPQYPSPRTFVGTGALAAGRANVASEVLADGRVLVAGGSQAALLQVATAEVYDPSTGKLTAVSDLSLARSNAMAELLPDGDVLVCGGLENLFASSNSCELFDAATGTFSATGSMATPRVDGSLDLLGTGEVLVVGGRSFAGTTATCELYDPAAGTWSATGSMASARRYHVAVRLGDGDLLVCGGFDAGGTEQATCERYDPAAGTWSATGAMAVARSQAAGVLLRDGRVLVMGGGGFLSTVASAELYDPVAGTWSSTSDMSVARRSARSVVLPDGFVLVAGGYGASLTAQSSAEVFDPVAGTFTTVGAMAVTRQSFSLHLLPTTGRVFVVGSAGDLSGTCELFR